MKTLLKGLLLVSALTASINCLAIDSAHVKQQNVVAMNPNVTLNDCITTEKEKYVVTITNPTPAYPTCPPNMVMKKINFKTDTSFLDVITYVSVECCKQQIGWSTAS